MAIRTRSLFHFTKDLDTLEKILESGYFWPRYSKEDFSWLGNPTYSFGIPMVCFCDIPLSRIQDHITYYGTYGIGLKQEWGLAKGINPITYLNKDSLLKDSFIKVIKTLLEKHKDVIKNEKESTEWLKILFRFVASIKPYEGLTTHAGKSENKIFYEESEWRYVPDSDGKGDMLMPSEEMENPNKIQKRNAATLMKPLKFNPEDIKYLFVSNSKEIPRLYDFINAKLEHHAQKQIKILISKIVSLDELIADV